MKKSTKRIIAIAAAIAVIVPTSGSVLKHIKSANSTETEAASQPETVIETVAKVIRTTEAEPAAKDLVPTEEHSTTSPTTTKKAVTTTKAAKKNAVSTTKEINTEVLPTLAKEKDVPSQILKGRTAVNSWGVSSDNMKVHAEKIRVNLNVYKNGKPTGETVTKYVYAAIIEGPASGFKTMAASEVTAYNADTVPNIAKGAGAMFAVNGEMCSHKREEFYGFFNAANDKATGTVIKNSKAVQIGEPSPSLTISKDGTWQYPVTVSADNVQSLISSGVISSISYTYPVIWQGERWYIEGGAAIAPMWNERNINESNPSRSYFNDHTMLGQIDANKHVVLISEGFGRAYLCEMMEELGVQNACWLNGGHCSVMYIKGYGAVNRPNDHYLCHAADIMYF